MKTDISQAKSREEELLAEKERLQVLIDNYPDGFIYRAAMVLEKNDCNSPI